MINHYVSLQAAQAYLQQLDLNYIVDVMCASDYPLPRWERKEAETCATIYKNFLWLQKKYNYSLVPTREVDEFWHNHILYTKNYFHDCLNIFGHYLHHAPLEKGTETATLLENYMQTKQFYLQEFGVALDLIANA